MDALIRLLKQDDEPFLWQMLYHAAHMQEDGETSAEAAKSEPSLQKYVRAWGCASDMGVIALHPRDQRPLGAAWLRVFLTEKSLSAAVNEGTPELAIAVLPDYAGQGIGTQLLRRLLAEASQVYPAIVLSVRITNPARHLYERIGFVVVDTVTNRVGTASTVMLARLHPK